MGNSQAIIEFIQKYNLTTAVTLLVMGATAYAYAHKIVTNHLEHFKQDIVNAIERMGEKITIALLRDQRDEKTIK